MSCLLSYIPSFQDKTNLNKIESRHLCIRPSLSLALKKMTTNRLTNINATNECLYLVDMDHSIDECPKQNVSENTTGDCSSQDGEALTEIFIP